MIFLKSKDEILIMHEANKILHSILDTVKTYILPREGTQTLDSVAYSECGNLGVKPAFLGYKGFPKSLCVSVNHEIVHGIPSPDKILQEGDVVSIDFGIEYKGYFADAARTIIVGQAPENVIDLVKNTKLALYNGIEQMVVGNRLNDISSAIEKVAKDNKYGNIKKLVGHGIGRALHEDPQVLNYIDIKSPNIRLQEGLVLAIEPMFTLGRSDIAVMPDGWTAITVDKSIACHWELSVAIVDGKPFILGAENV